MSVTAWMTVLVTLGLVLSLVRVLKGPTVYDRMLGLGVAGTNAVILICLVGHLYGRFDMFVDIALAYAMLNFIAVLAASRYFQKRKGLFGE